MEGTTLRRLELVLCVLGATALACSLGAVAPATQVLPTAGYRGLPTETPVGAAVGLNLTPCAVRGDWPIYVVSGGDTLSDIAARTGSTPADLARANCLVNPDMLNAGQQLRVPRQPVLAPTPVVCTNTLPTRLTNALGAVGRVKIPPAAGSQLTRLPMNMTASTKADIVGYIPDGAAFNIVDGPYCGEATIWWRVNYNGLVGWVQETAGTSYYWLEPACSAP